MEAMRPIQPWRQLLAPVAAGLRAGRIFQETPVGSGRSYIFPLCALRVLSGELPLSMTDPPTPPGYRQRRRMYSTQPYLSRSTIIVSSPGEAFSLTEGLLMRVPRKMIPQLVKSRLALTMGSGAGTSFQLSGIDSRRQIFLASLLGISTCRGTASMFPVLGLDHNECSEPSLLR